MIWSRVGKIDEAGLVERSDLIVIPLNSVHLGLLNNVAVVSLDKNNKREEKSFFSMNTVASSPGSNHL